LQRGEKGEFVPGRGRFPYFALVNRYFQREKGRMRKERTPGRKREGSWGREKPALELMVKKR